MNPKTKTTVVIVAGLIGAFILGGVAFGVGAPLLGRMHDRAFEARLANGDWQGGGPRAWSGEDGRAFERGPGMMYGQRRGFFGRDGGPMMGQRGQMPCPTIDGDWTCPNCGQRSNPTGDEG